MLDGNAQGMVLAKAGGTMSELTDLKIAICLSAAAHALAAHALGKPEATHLASMALQASGASTVLTTGGGEVWRALVEIGGKP